MALDAIAKILQAGAFTRQQAEALLKFHDNITLTAQQIIDALGYTPASAAIVLTAGAGLIGGGDLSANRSFAIDPAVLAAIGNALPLSSGTATSNTVTGAGHTHQIISTTVGAAFLNLTNPSAIRFPRINADNSVSALDAASFRTAIGAAASTDLSSYVLKAGDTMTGALTNTAAIALDYQRTNGRMFIRDNGSGFPTIDFVNPANSASAVGRFTGAGFSFNGGAVDANAGLRTYNAGQVKVYDSNNDTPIELGLGYGSGTDRNGFLWNRNNGFISFGTNNVERMRIQAGGNVVLSGGALFVQNNDIYTYRAGGTTGVIYLDSGGSKYLYNDSTQYILPVQRLNVSAAGIEAAGTINSSTFAVTGLAGVQGWQIVWNTVQSGQGRMEFVNNRGGGAGGFTFYDRANTTVGTGTALAALTGTGLFVNGLTQFNTGGTTTGMISAWAGNASYVAFVNAGMSSTEYMILSANPGIDPSTYISSAAGGTVNIRPSANSTTGQVVFATTGVTFAQAATGPNFIATSDETLKHDDGIAELYDQLERLEIHDYRWIKDGKRGRGVMAQQARKIAPAYVYVDANGKLGVDKAGLAIEIALRALRLAQQRK